MASNQSLPIVHKRISVRSSEKRVVEILQRYLKKGSVKLTSSHERRNYTDYYVSGTKDDIQNLQRSIEDSVAYRGLASTVAGIEDVQAPVLDIGLCCHSLFKKSNSYKEEKKGDIITNMKSISYYQDPPIPIDYEIHFKRNTHTESPDSSECQDSGTTGTIVLQVTASHFSPFFPSPSIPNDVKTAVQNCLQDYKVTCPQLKN